MTAEEITRRLVSAERSWQLNRRIKQQERRELAIFVIGAVAGASVAMLGMVLAAVLGV